MQSVKGFFGPFRFLSNFYPAEVEYQGMKYRTTEHAYQAAKFADPVMRYTIQQLELARDAKKHGRAQGMREDWDIVKYSIMFDLLLQKFANPELAKLLLATGDAYLEETNTWGDVYWGVCNGVGENKLGLILMEIRSMLRDLSVLAS